MLTAAICLYTHIYIYVRTCKRVLLAKFRPGRHGSYYRVIETRTNGFRTDSQWRVGEEEGTRPAKFFVWVNVSPPSFRLHRETLTIKSFSLIATAGYPSGKLQSWISSVKKPDAGSRIVHNWISSGRWTRPSLNTAALISPRSPSKNVSNRWNDSRSRIGWSYSSKHRSSNQFFKTRLAPVCVNWRRWVSGNLVGSTDFWKNEMETRLSPSLLLPLYFYSHCFSVSKRNSREWNC